MSYLAYSQKTTTRTGKPLEEEQKGGKESIMAGIVTGGSFNGGRMVENVYFYLYFCPMYLPLLVDKSLEENKGHKKLKYGGDTGSGGSIKE